ncbi:hypothetical protein HYR99_19865 [Candidatus Poribacteria bacterium]|nr:hypothetical protein [Candidatus Poribacteria bacterium]
MLSPRSGNPNRALIVGGFRHKVGMALLARLQVRVASDAGGEIRQMSQVRMIRRGERVADIMEEAKVRK